MKLVGKAGRLPTQKEQSGRMRPDRGRKQAPSFIAPAGRRPAGAACSRRPAVSPLRSRNQVPAQYTPNLRHVRRRRVLPNALLQIGTNLLFSGFALAHGNLLMDRSRFFPFLAYGEKPEQEAQLFQS